VPRIYFATGPPPGFGVALAGCRRINNALTSVAGPNHRVATVPPLQIHILTSLCRPHGGRLSGRADGLQRHGVHTPVCVTPISAVAAECGRRIELDNRFRGIPAGGTHLDALYLIEGKQQPTGIAAAVGRLRRRLMG